MTYAKPCPRTGKHGCCGVITARCAAHLARRKYCTNRCTNLGRRDAGWKPKVSPEHFVNAARIGGRASGQARRARAMKKLVAEVADLIPTAFWESLPARQQSLLLVLMGRTARRAYRLGKAADAMARKARRSVRQPVEQKGQAT